MLLTTIGGEKARMGISINDLENSLNSRRVYSLYGKETVSHNFRELSPEELKISGGETEDNSILVIDNTINRGGLTVYGEDLDVYLPSPTVYGDKVNVYGDNVNVYKGRLPDSVYYGEVTFDFGSTSST